MAERTAIAAHHPFTRAVARSLRRRCGVQGGAAVGEHVLAAVSGGADSVALLRALAALAPRRRWRLRLTVAHVHHHLRGDDAERDARFVKELAEALGLPFERADLSPDETPRNVEAWARRARYEALGQIAQRCSATHIATAHHGDDQLETLLMRMMRGTSVQGLRGIAWKKGFKLQGSEDRAHVVRPMLGVGRDDVTAFLREIGQTWCEDHTNADVSRERARLRRDVLPVLHDMRPDAAKRAVGMADHARDLDRWLRGEVRRAHRDTVRAEGGTYVMQRDALTGLARVVLTGLLHRVLREAGVPKDRLTRRAVSPMVRAVRDGKGGERVFEFAGGVRVTVTRDVVRMDRW